MKKRAIRLLSMLLALLMLTGCSSSILNDPLDRAYRALQRSFISAGRNLVPFNEMEYLRPDMSTISADFDAVNDALESGDIDSVSAALDACYLDYYNFDTMYTLADIRSCQDVYDSYYADEVSWCGENFTAVQQKMEPAPRPIWRRSWRRTISGTASRTIIPTVASPITATRWLS